MFKLLDRTFWNFVLGFVIILIASFSLLTIAGVFRIAEENVAALLEAFSGSPRAGN